MTNGGEHERTISSHLLGITIHDFEGSADVRRKVGLVDDQEIRAGDARTSLARDLVSTGNIDHVDREVGELGTEGRREIVATALDDDQVQLQAPAESI